MFSASSDKIQSYQKLFSKLKPVEGYNKSRIGVGFRGWVETTLFSFGGSSNTKVDRGRRFLIRDQHIQFRQGS